MTTMTAKMTDKYPDPEVDETVSVHELEVYVNVESYGNKHDTIGLFFNGDNETSDARGTILMTRNSAQRLIAQLVSALSGERSA